MVDYRAVEGVAGETKRMFMTRVQIECEEEVLWTDGVPAVCGRVAPVVERDGEHARTHELLALLRAHHRPALAAHRRVANRVRARRAQAATGAEVAAQRERTEEQQPEHGAPRVGRSSESRAPCRANIGTRAR